LAFEGSDLRAAPARNKYEAKQWTIADFEGILEPVDKLYGMKTFARIVEAGSLTAAAEALDTSLPTVVRTLAALERELGVTLLARTTRRIHLTDEGAQYLEGVRIILSAIEETEETLVARRSEPTGKLTVTASMLFGRRYVAPIVNEFLRRHPKVSADLLFVDRVVNLVEEGVDVGVRIGDLKDSSLMAIRVGQVRRVICATESYLRDHGMPQTPGDIGAHRCIRHTGLAARNEWQFRAGRKRNVSVPITSVVTCNDIDSSLNACVDGLGLGMFLSYMVAPFVRNGRLKYVLEHFETEPIPVQVVYPASRLLSSRVRTFIDACAEKLRHAEFD
jgi:DNA-binding transcriptional LysR family regulator